ncbi:hypothetical protein JHK85_001308 [Glycine max]|uniref:CCHC-type domain-containing protein n=1 Tax=Glycine soja TaxID=3848 RepID=A0A445M1D5_GLYSO|nr:hypothetical protein JHK87_001284 [Glycine soja]KAG5068931.1 hypothetical protein JHK85_001308 [Glycine max]KAG5088658.1 hypothetical protein JHK86_001270 [Glycine max]RZC29390.1 hypothetical protein D0Y65_001105 [Glycine soja]
MLEAKLKHDWAKKGAIKIIDVPRDYYQVLFTLDEDYNHALMEGYLLNFQYEVLHAICFSCGNYGHGENNCMEKKLNENAPQGTSMELLNNV